MDFEEYEKLKKVDEDRTWKAVYIAVIFHVIIFLAQWNVFQADAFIEEDQDVFEVQVYVPPPPPPEEPQVRRQRTVFRPIPDPNPEVPRVDYVEIPEDYYEPDYGRDDFWDDYDDWDIMPTAQVMAEYEVSEPPVLLSHTEPRYPEVARAARIQGNVIANVTVGIDGRVMDVQIIRGIRGAFEQQFNDAVLEAARTRVYQPAVHQGRPVPVRVVVTYTFRLR